MGCPSFWYLRIPMSVTACFSREIHEPLQSALPVIAAGLRETQKSHPSFFRGTDLPFLQKSSTTGALQDKRGLYTASNADPALPGSYHDTYIRILEAWTVCIPLEKASELKSRDLDASILHEPIPTRRYSSPAILNLPKSAVFAGLLAAFCDRKPSRTAC